MNLREIQAEVAEWAERNFGPTEGKEHQPLIGMMEELGELSHAHLKAEQNVRTNEDHEAARRDSLGDIVIYMCDYARRYQIDLQTVIEETWEQVKQRDWKKNPKSGKVLPPVQRPKLTL